MTMRKLLILLILSLVFVAGCENGQTDPNSAEPTVKENVKPIADAEVAVIEMEDGDAFPPITIELYSNIAPKFVARFKELAGKGFYNGMKYHRVSLDVIQTGDPNSKNNDPTDDGLGNSDLPNVDSEFSDIPYVPGVVGAARKSNDFNSANSQFFIMKRTQPAFDRKYTVFGRVTAGMGSVKTIGGAPVNAEKPVAEIVIKSIKIEKKK